VLEASWICAASNGVHALVPDAVLAEAQRLAEDADAMAE
jgi:hypothetical protein